MTSGLARCVPDVNRHDAAGHGCGIEREVDCGAGDLGWVGGLSIAASLAVLLLRGRQERLKPYKIAG